MPKGLTVLCAAKLHANQLERHLELFEYIDEVERVLVVRNAPVPERLSKVENRTFRKGNRAAEAARMVQTVNRVIQEEHADWVVGFNPVPWGSLALSAAKRRKVPTCLSLIGMDFLQIQRKWGRPFLEAVRRSAAVTVTGRKMLEGLVDLGVPAERISILPHSVDTNRFVPNEEKKERDVIAVGQLIERKRMDTLIDAIALSRKKGRDVRLGILGRGPLEEELKKQSDRLGVSDLVEFLGYRDDVESVLASAHCFALASQWEGVPFAMMEAMSAGLVPIVTDVGTIADWVRPNENGRLFPVGDAEALCQTMDELFRDEGRELQRLRHVVLSERDRLSFQAGADVWRNIFGLSPRPTSR